MFRLTSLSENGPSLDALSRGLVHHMQASGMSLPEDDDLLDYVRESARMGRMDGALIVRRVGLRERACGVAAWRVEHGAGVISLLYLLPDMLPGQAPDAARALLERARRSLTAQDAPLGIYAELPEVAGPVREALRACGFVGVERLIMRADLSGRAWTASPPAGYTLRSWEPADLTPAAHVIYRANVGALDAQIIPELRSEEAVRQIVWQTTVGRYGAFDVRASGVVLDAGGALVGVTLATRRRSGQGFTAEICVLPEHRRRGLARALIVHSHASFQADGILTGMLGVTDGNPARCLYESLGYNRIGSVWTYVWPRPEGWPIGEND